MHNVTQNYDVSLAKEFQKHLIEKHRRDGVIDQGKYKKTFMERKWTDIQYHVQDNDDVSHQDVKTYCSTNKFPELSFCGPHSKTYVARRLSKNYHLRFDPKLGMGTCAIYRIPCACVACT